MAEDIVIYTPMYTALFWAIVLFISKNENNRAKFFLGIIMTVAFLLYLSHAHFFKKISVSYLAFDPIYILTSLSMYPLYYWYIKLLTVEPEYRMDNIWSLIPGAFFALVTIVIYMLMSTGERQIYINELLGNREISSTDTILIRVQKINFFISRIVFLVQVVYFLIKGHQLVKRYNLQVANFYSNLENKSLQWVNYLLYSFVATSLMSIVFNFIGRSFFMDSPLLLLIPSLIFSVLLFIIGMLGYKQNPAVENINIEEPEIENTLNRNFNLSKLEKGILELFEKEAIYKNPELKITQVSDMLRTNRTYISKFINTEYSCTFSDFVNKYRVEEAKRLLADKTSMNFSLNYISEKSGFGSMGSFMRVFRDIEGITPGTFRERVIANKTMLN